MTIEKYVALIKQVFRFGFVGVISTLVDYCGFLFFTYTLSINYIVSSTISYSIGIIVNYLLSMRYVFKSRDDRSKRKEFIIFTILTLIGLVANQIFLYVFVEMCGISEPVSKIYATVLVMVYNFISRKLYVEDRSQKN